MFSSSGEYRCPCQQWPLTTSSVPPFLRCVSVVRTASGFLLLCVKDNLLYRKNPCSIKRFYDPHFNHRHPESPRNLISTSSNGRHPLTTTACFYTFSGSLRTEVDHRNLHKTGIFKEVCWPRSSSSLEEGCINFMYNSAAVLKSTQIRVFQGIFTQIFFTI